MDSSPNTAFQLYSAHDSDESLPALIRRIGAAGYDGVEFANRFPEEPPEAVATALDEAGIEPVAAHAALTDIEKALAGESDLLDRCRTVGCDRLVIPHLSAREVRTPSAVRSLAQRLRDVAGGLDEHDMRLGYHTGRETYRPFLPDAVGSLATETPIPEGVAEYTQRLVTRLDSTDPTTIPSETPLWNLVARTHPSELFFELEAAETTEAGYDPAAVLSLCGDRMEMVHLRDVTAAGPLQGYEHVPHGAGSVDLDGVVEAAVAAGVDWLIYENELDTDPTEKIEHGAEYMERLLDDDTQTLDPERRQAITS